jgi:Holliday junction DNA helicase RuvA
MEADARLPMIGWLQGRLNEPWQQANRQGVLLCCQGVGYEVQLCDRHWQRLPGEGSPLTLYIHQTVREDGSTLYGFPERRERDLFRELVAVSGVGPQMALGLLTTMEVEELVLAIVQGDLRRLSQAPGVGKRTAERLSVELRQRLQERYGVLLAASADAGDAAEADLVALTANCRDEVQLTLTALGYEMLEIHRAIRAVAAEGLAAGSDGDDWIRECLRWLSRTAA